MTKLFKSLCGTALVLAMAAPLAAQTKPAPTPASATAPSGPIVPGLGVANLDAVIVNSNAYQVAQQQRPVTYKATVDAYNTRAQQLDAQLKVMIDKFNADRAAKKPDAVLQQQYGAIQQFEAQAKEELQRLRMPITLSEAYVIEQIAEKLDQAVQNAMSKRGITILLSPEAVIARTNAYELSPAIIAELNVLIPAANLVPPQGWVPRAAREQQAAQGQAQQPRPAAGTPAAPKPAAPRPVGPQPEGR
jgi:Skp family chaperone for outer membrane proteins